jgi:hypothetical protein
MAYDYLLERNTDPQKASKEYLKILDLAAKESETKVDDALRLLFESGDAISLESVGVIVESNEPVPSPTALTVPKIDLRLYDQLIKKSWNDWNNREVNHGC